MLVEAETQLCIGDGKRALLAYPCNAAPHNAALRVDADRGERPAPRFRAAVKGSRIKITPVFKFETLWYIISNK